MQRRSFFAALTIVALAALGVFSSAAVAEHVVTTKVHFTEGPEPGGEYFSEGNTLTCKGVHIENKKHPGGINPRNGRLTGGEDITHCKLAKGETFPSRWQTPGDEINIDDNFWRSGDTGQEVAFMELRPAYGVIYSKVGAHDNSFVVKVAYPVIDEPPTM